MFYVTENSRYVLLTGFITLINLTVLYNVFLFTFTRENSKYTAYCSLNKFGLIQHIDFSVEEYVSIKLLLSENDMIPYGMGRMAKEDVIEWDLAKLGH